MGSGTLSSAAWSLVLGRLRCTPLQTSRRGSLLDSGHPRCSPFKAYLTSLTLTSCHHAQHTPVHTVSLQTISLTTTHSSEVACWHDSAPTSQQLCPVAMQQCAPWTAEGHLALFLPADAAGLERGQIDNKGCASLQASVGQANAGQCMAPALAQPGVGQCDQFGAICRMWECPDTFQLGNDTWVFKWSDQVCISLLPFSGYLTAPLLHAVDEYLRLHVHCPMHTCTRVLEIDFGLGKLLLLFLKHVIAYCDPWNPRMSVTFLCPVLMLPISCINDGAMHSPRRVTPSQWTGTFWGRQPPFWETAARATSAAEGRTPPDSSPHCRTPHSAPAALFIIQSPTRQ